MSDRDRLIELLLQSDPIKERDLDDEWFDGETEDIADHLLANGVIVPPCKVGDIVYALWSVPTKTKYIVYCAEVKKISQYKKNCRLTTIFELEPIEYRGRRKEYYIDEFGKLVFLTKEEAEKALAERSGNNAKM